MLLTCSCSCLKNDFPNSPNIRQEQLINCQDNILDFNKVDIFYMLTTLTARVLYVYLVILLFKMVHFMVVCICDLCFSKPESVSYEWETCNSLAKSD